MKKRKRIAKSKKLIRKNIKKIKKTSRKRTIKKIKRQIIKSEEILVPEKISRPRGRPKGSKSKKTLLNSEEKKPSNVYFTHETENAIVAYNETEDPDNAEKFRLEPAVTDKIFEIAEKLDHFKNPLESGLKVANMGKKTFVWEDGDAKTQSTFNFSQSEDARALVDIMENAGDSVRMLIELRRVIRHDRLGGVAVSGTSGHDRQPRAFTGAADSTHVKGYR